MKSLRYISFIISWLILIIIVFYLPKWNLTGHYISILLVIVLQNIGMEVDDKTIKRLNSMIIALFIVAVLILGFGFNYFI